MAEANPFSNEFGKESELDAKHDHLITELESSEGHTASTLRLVGHQKPSSSHLIPELE